MVYYRDDEVAIRRMEERDAEQIAAEERRQGWDASADKYLTRLRDMKEGRAVALVAEYRGNTAGYVNVYFQAGGAFRDTKHPEIVDFGVLEKYRRRGIGSRLMDTAEALAGERSGAVCIGVGLHSGYGSAQRMYVKRGYVPDGTGVWYQDEPAPVYGDCRNDDDLVLYMSKYLGE